VTAVNGELYCALIEAGASQDEARKSAEVIGSSERRLAALEMPVERVDCATMILTFLLGIATAIQIGNLLLSLEILSRLPHS